MKPIFYLLFIALLLSSCGKKATIHITAKNAVTGVPYSGLTYYLVRSTSGGSGEKTKTIATGTLNENGEIVLTERLSRSSTYAVRVEPPGNTCYNKQITFYLGTEDKFECPFEFAECAYLTLSVNNINCQGPNDRILFDLQPVYISDYNDIIPIEKFGCYSNTFIESQVPYGQWEATWEVTRNGITTYHDTIFYIDKNEHYNFVINY